ncbi:hypothetical protein V6N12_047103 [Hibiscus sabdariffa]|uniref:RNase H type-1 domain-containing protein n=1 Tax=Hibiscus sabdariffa TaxID=183260 RepID=A0ABR2B427_9ROSI
MDGQLIFSCNPNINPTPAMVADMVDDVGSWDWARLLQWLPHVTLEKIAAVKPPQIGAGTDLIWKHRCNEIFDNNPLHESALISYGNQLAKDFDSVHSGVKNLRITQPAAWCPPPHGWMKANCDGAVNTKDGRAAIGVLVKDILKLIARPWIVHIRHINQSKNKVADTLAALSRDKSIGEEIFERPPKEVMIELNRDMIG